MSSKHHTIPSTDEKPPRPSGTPPEEGNGGTENSPPLEGWQAKPDGVVVPKLRFPEFLDAGDWTTVKLDAVAKIRTEKVGGNVCVPMSITSGVGLVSQKEKFGRVIAGDSYKNYLLLKPNEFAYNKSATKDYRRSQV